MTYKTLLYLILMGTCFSGMAQNIFEPGYIVSLGQDTLRGYIMEQSDAEMAYSVKFRSQKKTGVKKYLARDLRGFGFNNGRVFQQMPVISRGEESNDTTYVFAKNTVRGKIDLFVWRHPQKTVPDIFLANNLSGQMVHLKKPKSDKFRAKKRTEEGSYLENLERIKTTENITTFKPVKYSEKHITRDIVLYNTDYREIFPVEEYIEKRERKLDILGGIPIGGFSNDLHFRAGIYYNRSRPEISSNFALISGLVYHHWETDYREIPPNYENGELNIKSQLVNIIPIGINFHGNTGRFRPYGYAGIGAAAIKANYQQIENSQYTGDVTKYTFGPTLNTGIGVKIKVGKNFFIAELTPTINRVFFNLGFSL